MEVSRIKFKTKDGIFEPDRIGGTREAMEKLGMEVLGDEAEDSCWIFENVDVRIPNVIYDVELHYDENDRDDKWWSGDVSLDGVRFGYVYLSDIEIISGYDPRKDYKI